MANALAPRVCEGLQSELRITLLRSRGKLRHCQNQNAVAVGRIGELAIHELGQDDFPVVGSYGPLCEENLWLSMARATIFPTNSELVTPDSYRNVSGFQPWHRCGQDKKIVGLMHLDGNGLWVLQACSHYLLLHREHS
jgi:hypothetical protein